MDCLNVENKLQGKQNGSIGIPLAANWMVPFTNSLFDQTATQRAIDFRIGWYRISSTVFSY